MRSAVGILVIQGGEDVNGLYQKFGFVPTDEHCKVMVKKISEEQERG